MSTQNSGKNLLTEVRDVLRYLHYSIHTERAYCDWVARFVRYHRMDSRAALFDDPVTRVEDFLTHLAVNEQVAASTQNQAFNALIFLYGRVLKQPLQNVSAARSRKQQRIPVVLTRDEVKQVLTLMAGTSQLVTMLLYGCGLRITERESARTPFGTALPLICCNEAPISVRSSPCWSIKNCKQP